MENERTRRIIVFRPALLRLFSSRRYWIEVITATLICYISPYIIEIISKLSESFPPEVIEGFKQANVYNIGLLSVPSLDILSYTYCDRIISGVLSGSVTQCLLIVIPTTFIAGEFSKGYFIRALMLGEKRSYMLAKYIAVSLLGTLLPIILCPTCVGVSLTMRYNMPIYDSAALINTLIIQVFMLLELVVCFASIAIALTGKGTTVLGLGCVMMLPLLPNYVQVFTDGNIKIEDYILVSRIVNSCEMLPTANDVIVAVSTAAVFYGLSWLITSVRNF